MCSIKKSFLQGLLSLFCLGSVQAQTQPNPMNVLFIGNSYTHMHNMPELFEKIAESKKIKINVEMSAKSSHSFKMHCERPELFDKIKSKKWDYIILQGFSRELMFDYECIDTASVPYFNNIIDSIYANNPCTSVLLYKTWGYREGFSEFPEADSYYKMTQRVSKGYQYLSNIYDLPVVPVGDVWKYVKEKYPNINLYMPDDQHPTEAASYLIACTFYAAIFKSAPLNVYTSKLNETEAEQIQKAAFKIVNSNLDSCKLKNNTLDVTHEKKGNSYYVKCKAYYPKADSLSWDFGDGIRSTEKNVVHKYKKPGTYYIKLTVHDVCGVREIYRKVHFVEPTSPEKNKTSKPKTNSSNKKKI